MKLFSIQETANILAVSTKTLRRWEDKGILVPHRTPGNQRRYTQDQVDNFRQQKRTDLPQTSPHNNQTNPTKRLFSIQETANILAVSTKTLRRWEDKGILVPLRTRGNQRRYMRDQVDNFRQQRIGLPQISTAYSQISPVQLLSYPQETEELRETSPDQIQEGAQYWTEELIKSILVFKKLAIFAVLIMLFVAVSGVGVATLKSANLLNIASIPKVLSILGIGKNNPQVPQISEILRGKAVLGAGTTANNLVFDVNVKSKFADSAQFLDTIRVAGIATLSGGVITENQDVNAGTGKLTASNVLYGAIAGAGIAVGPGQTPTITNTGVLSLTAGSGISVGTGSKPTVSNTGVISLGGSTGALTLIAGTGISISGLSISNSDLGTAQNIFKTIVVTGSNTITASSNTDTLTLTSGAGIVLSSNSTSKEIKIVSSATSASWQENANALSPFNIGDDVLVGGITTASAKFGFINVSGGTPTIQISGNSVLTATTLGSSITTSSLTSVGTITTGVWNASVIGLANGGTNANLSVVPGGIVYSGGSALAISLAGNPNQCLLSGGAGTPTWGTCVLGSNFWTQALGAIYPSNSTVDLLVGGSASTSAKFAVLNVNGSTTPVASVSATTASGGSGTGLVLSGGGSIQSLLNANLTLGGGTTGGINFTPGNIQTMFQSSIGRIGIGTQTNPKGLVDIAGDAGNNATLILNNTGVSTADLFTASSSGVTKFTIANNGNIQFAGSTSFLTTLTSAATAARTITFPDAAGTLCLQASSSCGFAMGSTTNWWNSSLGALYPINSTLDLLVGGSASTSAKFAVLNVNGSTTPVASVSATTASGGSGTGLVLSGGGSIQSLLNANLTLGGGTTGGINFTPGNIQTMFQSSIGRIGIGTQTNPKGLVDIAGDAGNNATLILNNTGVSTADLFTASSSGITKFVINNSGTVGINTGANSSTLLGTLDVRPNLTNGGTLSIASASGATSFAGLLVDNTGVGDLFTASKSGATKFTILNNGNIKLAGTTNFLTTLTSLATAARTISFPDAAGTICLSANNCAADSFWNQAAGLLYAGNTTVDFAIGGSASTSAKFAVLNINSGTPTATVAGNFIVMPYTSGASELGGNVGIGDTAPSQLLSLASNVNPAILFEPKSVTSPVSTGIGPKNPGTATDIVGGGGSAWSTSGCSSLLDCVNNNDTKRTTASPLNFVDFSDDLRATNFNFNIPTGATIRGLVVEIERDQTVASQYQDNSFIIVGGPSTCSDQSQGSFWSTTESYATYGSPTNNLGCVGLTATQVNSSSFGVTFAILCAHNPTCTGSARVNHIRMTVYYSMDDWIIGPDANNGAEFKLSNSTALGTNDYMAVNNAGNVGIGTTSPASELHVTRPLSFGVTGKALAIFDQIENQDILTASASGVTKFIISNAGNLLFNQTSGITMNTSAGSDSNWLGLSGGGAVNDNTRGAYLDLFGNQVNAFNLNGKAILGSGLNGSITLQSVASTIVNQIGANTIDIFTASASGNTRFVITNSGSVNIGTGIASVSSTFNLNVMNSSNSTASAQIWNTFPNAGGTGACTNSLCHTALSLRLGTDPSTGNPGSPDRFINFATGNSFIVGKVRGNGAGGVAYDTAGGDYAEWFQKENPQEQFNYGDIVCLNQNGKVVKCDGSNTKILGAVTDTPGFVGNSGNDQDPSYILVGLLGQIRVKVSSQNGPIKGGDMISYSNTPGTGAKAVNKGFALARAVEPFTGTDSARILVYVNPTWYDPQVYFGLGGSLSYPQSTQSAALSLGLSGVPPLLAGQAQTALPSSNTATSSGSFDLAGNQLFKDLQNRVGSVESKIEDLRSQIINSSTQSAFLASINSGPAVLGASTSADFANNLSNLDIASATISADLMVLGRTTTADLGVTGNISAGLLSIHGLDSSLNNGSGGSSINTVGDLNLQNNQLGGINILSGKVLIDTRGNIKTEGEIIAKKVNIDTTASNAASLGSGTLPAGQTSVTISTTTVTEKSKILVTPTTKTGNQVLVVINKSIGSGFTVEIDQAYDKDIAFDWWIVDAK